MATRYEKRRMSDDRGGRHEGHGAALRSEKREWRREQAKTALQSDLSKVKAQGTEQRANTALAGDIKGKNQQSLEFLKGRNQRAAISWTGDESRKTNEAQHLNNRNMEFLKQRGALNLEGVRNQGDIGVERVRGEETRLSAAVDPGNFKPPKPTDFKTNLDLMLRPFATEGGGDMFDTNGAISPSGANALLGAKGMVEKYANVPPGQLPLAERQRLASAQNALRYYDFVQQNVMSGAGIQPAGAAPAQQPATPAPGSGQPDGGAEKDFSELDKVLFGN
jgi:hypothetical protein